MLVGNVHLVCGDVNALSALCAELAKAGIAVTGSDAYVRAYAQFGIGEARELISRAEMRPVSAPRRTFILAMPGMTADAQNALLKTLEEPPASAMFFFILPSPEMLLPTLRSRAQRFLFAAPSAAADGAAPDAQKFLAADTHERLTMLAPLLKKDSDDRHDVSSIFTFLSSIEHTIAKRGATPALKCIYRARKYMNDKGSLKKVLLEQVALLLPRV